jgi:hypothetical protein
MSNAPPLPDVLVNFYDNYIPSLKDGQYTVTLSQALAVNAAVTKQDGGDPTQVPAQPQPPVSQTFIVNGPRFVLPPGDVTQLFPPAGSTGVYDQYLPQIVLNQQAVPWERNLELQPSQLPSGVSATAIPWVALLTFAEGELPGPQPPPPAGTQQNPTLASSVLLNNVVNSSFNGTPTAGPPQGTLGPTLVLEDNEDPTQLYCNVIDVPVAVFNALIPSVNDLRYLAHVRQVSLQNKAAVQGQTGWFSSVVSNRFAVPPAGAAPQTGNIVHLVSLEGLEPYLTADGPPNVTGYDFVRMVSLSSWAYTSQQDPAENFRTLMLNLISDSSEAGTDLLLRLPLPNPSVPSPDPATTQAVLARLQQGYAPLSYVMLGGDQTFAWYRGPLSPVPVQRFLAATGPGQAENPAVPFTTGDAMIFDPATGLFDQSYAAAFQTGRSLALASKPFATSLLNWRLNAHGVVDLILEYMTSPVYAGKMLQDGFIDADGNLTATGVTDLAPLLDANIVTGAFKDFFATEFYQTLAAKVGQEGGFTTADNTLIVEEAAQPPAAGPADLLALMQQPLVVSLLQHLAGLDNLGTLALPLAPGASTLTLAAGGAGEALAAGVEIILYSPDGTQSAWVTVAADAAAGATSVSIQPYAGTVTFAAGSTLQIQDSDEDAQQVVEWLAATALLYNVPFNNLVAHPSLLPSESIRFFYLDQNWTDALLDGALSVGLQTSRDSLFQQLMRDKLYEGVQAVMAEVRDALLGVAAQGHAPVAVAPAGFIVRSQGITGWRGLEIRAWSAADSVNPMKPLRLDALAGDVLLCIYPDLPVKITFTEPSEGLVFGMEDEGVGIRYIPGVTNFTAANIGTVIPNEEDPVWITPAQIATANRSSTNTAMNIAGPNSLVQLIQSTLPGQPALTPASFAVEMIRVPEQMLFTPAPATLKAP